MRQLWGKIKENCALIKWREPIDFKQVFDALSSLVRMETLGLKAKLAAIILVLTFSAVFIVFIMDSIGVKEIAEAIQSQNEDLSQAFKMSVEEITTQGFTNQARLQDFVSTLKRKGVREISILSNDRQVMESSNPNKVGKVIPPKHKDFLLTGALGDEEGEEGSKRKIYNLVIPVVVKDEQLGYINLQLHLEDFDSLLASLRIRRLLAIIFIFGVGVVGAIFLAARYTKPIGALVDAARNVAQGDLSKKVPVPKGKKDEIGELSITFNEMIERLRENQVLQKKLAKAERLSQMGQLSAGIAHEIRNPLNYLSLGLDHVRDGLKSGKDPSKLQVPVERMKKEVLRLSHLVKNFLTYGKPINLNIRQFDLSQSLKESMHLLSDQFTDQNIKIEKELEEGILLSGDEEHLKSCFMNVVTNAVQALSSGGVIKISAKKDTISKKAYVEVKDNGEGMDEETLKKIGEPFFTTKEGGIGVGMAITKKILSAHDGKISITSKKGEGTAVKMTLTL